MNNTDIILSLKFIIIVIINVILLAKRLHAFCTFDVIFVSSRHTFEPVQSLFAETEPTSFLQYRRSVKYFVWCNMLFLCLGIHA